MSNIRGKIETKTKICSTCGIRKNKVLFYNNKESIDKKRSDCKRCCKKYKKLHLEKQKAIDKRPETMERKRLYNLSVKGAWYVMKCSNTSKKYGFTMTRQDFLEWWQQQNQVCIYCNRTKEECVSNDKFHQRLTIDRMDNNRGYDLNNIALACYRCNSMKSATFTYEEMLLIGKVLFHIYWDRKIGEKSYESY